MAKDSLAIDPEPFYADSGSDLLGHLDEIRDGKTGTAARDQFIDLPAPTDLPQLKGPATPGGQRTKASPFGKLGKDSLDLPQGFSEADSICPRQSTCLWRWICRLEATRRGSSRSRVQAGFPFRRDGGLIESQARGEGRARARRARAGSRLRSRAPRAWDCEEGGGGRSPRCGPESQTGRGSHQRG